MNENKARRGEIPQTTCYPFNNEGEAILRRRAAFGGGSTEVLPSAEVTPSLERAAFGGGIDISRTADQTVAAIGGGIDISRTADQTVAAKGDNLLNDIKSVSCQLGVFGSFAAALITCKR